MNALGNRSHRLTASLVAVLACAVGACGEDSTSFTGGGGDAATGGSAAAGATSAGGSAAAGGGTVGQCTGDEQCELGSICQGTQCVPGCNETHGCPSGLECCDGQCFDLASSPEHCNSCEHACPTAPHVPTLCTGGVCGLGECEDGFYDCDGQAGCEASAECACTPSEEQPCYPGPDGTEDVGTCHGGTRTCNSNGLGWGVCVGYVEPVPEICANGGDEDCNGTADDVFDLDADGWTRCDGDCCDEIGPACGTPDLVNPGAFEFVGNSVDDDCDPATPDNVAADPCSSEASFAITGTQLAQAMDLCQFTTADPPLPQKKWGVISAELVLPSGTTPNATQLSDMQNWQGAVLANYGTGGIVPRFGATMAGISSGRMRDANDPGYATWPSTSFASYSTPPASYLAAHGGSLPASAGCSGTCPAGSGANDGINLRMSIRVPTNALSFSYDFRFFSVEYWTYQCTAYNDFYLALLTSAAAGIPADKNISFDTNNNAVSVNNGFFDLCVVKGCNTCPAGTAELAGTGMDYYNYGGGTVWLVTTAPVVPGETMVLELMVFDVSDAVLDSLTILDDFQWSIEPSDVGTTPID